MQDRDNRINNTTLHIVVQIHNIICLPNLQIVLLVASYDFPEECLEEPCSSLLKIRFSIKFPTALNMLYKNDDSLSAVPLITQ